MPINRAISRFHMGEPIEGGDEPNLLKQGAVEEANFERENAGQENAARAESYRMDIGDGREAVRSLGKRLYKHESVKAFIEDGDVAHLAGLVPDDDIPVLAEGLRARKSARQIADDIDPPEAPPVTNVYVTTPEVTANITTPPVTIAEGAVKVAFTQAEQQVPVVNVNVPEQPAPVVNVTTPAKQDVRIVSMPKSQKHVYRDVLGQITDVVEE